MLGHRQDRRPQGAHPQPLQEAFLPDQASQKAAQLGQIREMTEDPATGSLTIVVEV